MPRLADSPLHPPRFYCVHDAEGMLNALEGWKRDPNIRVRQLAPVNLPAGKMREAWAAFPGFRVAFQPSGQPGMVALSYELPRSPLTDGVVVAPLPPQRRHTITVDGL